MNTENVTIRRELLERAALLLKDSLQPPEGCADFDDWTAQGNKVSDELRPRQPESEGLEVVGWYHSHAEVATSDKARVVQWLPECIEPLCRLSDHQRAIAELRDRLDVMTRCADNYSRMFEESAEELDAAREILAQQGRRNTDLRAERDTLLQQVEAAGAKPDSFKHGYAFAREANQAQHGIRLQRECDNLRQQLAERDAQIASMRAEVTTFIETHWRPVERQRDRLADLLADVKADYTNAIYWEDMHADMKRIDAALAEVEGA